MSEAIEQTDIKAEEPAAETPVFKPRKTKAKDVLTEQTEQQSEPIQASAKEATAEKALAETGKCVCCGGLLRGGECTLCESISDVAPTINGKSFAQAFEALKPGEKLTYSGSLRHGRDRDALARHGVTSVFSTGGIVAAAARAGFTVLSHSPIVIQKPVTHI